MAKRQWTAVADEISACRRQLRACERAFEHEEVGGAYVETDDSEAERGYLGYRLHQAFLRLSILIEKEGLPLVHEQFVKGFARFEGKLDQVGQVPGDPESLYSEPLTYLDQAYDALSEMLTETEDRTFSGIRLFESILRQTPFILEDRAIEPTNEAEVRKPLFDMLKTVFPDTRREIEISHPLKTWKCDLGVSSIKAIAEVKYATSERELRSQLDGIYADMRGYSGDGQWTTFFALLYTTKPIAHEARLAEEFKLANADVNWTPIIVHGAGTRNRRSRNANDATDAIAGGSSAPPA